MRVAYAAGVVIVGLGLGAVAAVFKNAIVPQPTTQPAVIDVDPTQVYVGPPTMEPLFNCATDFVVFTCDPRNSAFTSTSHVYWSTATPPVLDLTQYWSTEARSLQKQTFRIKPGTWFLFKFQVKEWPTVLESGWMWCP